MRPSRGGAATTQQRDQARAVSSLRSNQLDAVRTAAGHWQAGLAGLSGTIGIFGLVKGADDVNGLTTTAGIVYGACLGLALLCSISGGVLAMRAAFGLPKTMRTSVILPEPQADAVEARESTRLLHAAIAFTIASVALVAAALAIAWYGPSPEPSDVLVHETSGAEDCGSVIRLGAGQLVLTTSTGQRTLPVGRLDGLDPVKSCPNPGG